MLITKISKVSKKYNFKRKTCEIKRWVVQASSVPQRPFLPWSGESSIVCVDQAPSTKLSC